VSIIDFYFNFNYFTLLFYLHRYVDDNNVVQDGQLITSRGPGTAYDFGLKIAENLVGAEKTEEVAKAMLWNWKK
jgi:protein DJ-1